MEPYRLARDPEGNEWLDIPYRGRGLLCRNMYNRGLAFTAEERKQLGLTGLLPSQVNSLDEQLRRAYGHIARKTDPLEQFIGLSELEARNAVLYYRLVLEHIEEFLPIVYTPTVGLACQEYSHIFRRGRGLWISPGDRGRIKEVLDCAPYEDVRLIVVTDNQRILGLGDLGAGGMGIPVGKLALYTVGAGIHPTQTLPISLDVGTDNEELLNDPLYMGWPHKRLRGAEYDELVEEFVSAVVEKFPQALLQWEDFKKANAFNLLDRYRDRLCSFNDDIQGTAGVAVAGIFAASRISKVPIAEQRAVIVGGGAAGIGIGRLLRDTLKKQGVEGAPLIQSIAILDSQGLLVEGRAMDDAYKNEFAWPRELAAQLDVPEKATLKDYVAALKPTVLIGTSGRPGTFDEQTVRTMAEFAERPVICPFSNPTSQAEAKPVDLIRWTDGRALVATGSPFDPVEHNGKTIHIGQGNNVYIFPGVGLGAIAAGARRVTESMFSAAAHALANCIEQEDLDRGSLYPPLTKLRKISAEIAFEVGRTAVREEVAKPTDDATLRAQVDRAMWTPDYPRIKAT